MLQANELRIGNYVLDAYDRIALVESISMQSIRLTTKTYRYESFKHDQAKPIQLTEDIILKLSTSHEFFHDGVIIYKIGFIHIWTQNARIWVQNPIRLEHIKHLHQLQNLYFALTQQELEIKQK